MTIARLLPFEVLPGSRNMAADELMLEWAVAGTASVRFYGWAEPTLSLGYFQPISVRKNDPLLASLSFVRRSTGGGAIVHHRELTYCIGIPVPLVGDEPWGCKMHQLIAEVLASFDVSADPIVCGEEKKTDPILCFHHHTAGDLAIGQRSTIRNKVVGSAQRKQQGAIVQHGTILLAQSEFAPSLPGILELTGQRLEPQQFAKQIIEKMSDVLGWELNHSIWSEKELKRRDQISSEKYGHREWTEKR